MSVDIELELVNDILAACASGDIIAVNMLLNNGVSVNAVHHINGWTPLHWASKRGHADVVRLLLVKGADATIKNSKGETPADLAASSVASIFNIPPEKTTRLQEENAKQFIPNYLRKDDIVADVPTDIAHTTPTPAPAPTPTPIVPSPTPQLASNKGRATDERRREVRIFRRTLIAKPVGELLGAIFIRPSDTLEDTHDQIHKEMDYIDESSELVLFRIPRGQSSPIIPLNRKQILQLAWMHIPDKWDILLDD
ncbi:hypothetical protein BC829DRAFT_493363 [Chytridium lagenaria]|nr:hypothetical protein BC829DRAFT_493363 [Chytridium lagenaria]